MGVSAQAVGRNATGPEAVAAPPATAPIAVQPAVAFQSGLIAAPANLQASATPLTAPAAATVSFENSAFTAVPKVVAPINSNGQSTVRANLSSAFGAARGSSVLAVAARYLGVPYVYGGTTPLGWDCSGATSYIFRQLGIDNPILVKQWESTTSAWTQKGGFTSGLRDLLDSHGIRIEPQINGVPRGSLGPTSGVPLGQANNTNGALARDAYARADASMAS